MKRKDEHEAVLQAMHSQPDSKDVRIEEKYASKLHKIQRVLQGKALQRTTGTQSQSVIEEAAPASETNRYPTYANREVRGVKKIGDDKIAFHYLDKDQNKYGVEIFNSESTDAQKTV